VKESFLDGRIELRAGDSRDVLKTIADNSIDSIVTDPPYALVSIVKRFGNAKPENEKFAATNPTSAYRRASAGFMGKTWDTGETAFAVEFWAECLRVLKPGGHLVAFSGTRSFHRMACAIEDCGFEIRDQIGWTFGSGFPKSHNAGNGWGTALKPAWEPICLARKPLSEKTVAANILQHGTGAINIDGCRVDGVIGKPGNLVDSTDVDQTSIARLGKAAGASYRGRLERGEISGRWPANIIHDGSEEVMAAFPDADGGNFPGGGKRSSQTDSVYGAFNGNDQSARAMGDSGSAARFFYTAKADADDRLGSKHPTVKPVDLMQWLCRLVTPPGGTVLDPFAGTGTTGEAAFREGFKAVLIEREEEYQKDIRRRMALCMAGPEERKRESIKAKHGDVPFEAGSLFA